jgi:hypothetical protein
MHQTSGAGERRGAASKAAYRRHSSRAVAAERAAREHFCAGAVALRGIDWYASVGAQQAGRRGRASAPERGTLCVSAGARQLRSQMASAVRTSASLDRSV